MKTLFYGDNLEILRTKIADETIDLCYIDPPFNSKRNYFQIYNNIGGEIDKAQAQAFVDTWKWDNAAETGYREITTNQGGRFTRQAIELIKGLELILKKSDLLAYLIHMTLRLTEIYRVLKPTGTFYLHCDPTASHYLKLAIDAIFCSQGGDYLNEIIWCYDTGGRSKSSFPKKHDIIFRYGKSQKPAFYYDNVALPRDPSTMHETLQKDEEGRLYQRNIKFGKEYRYYLDKGVLPNDWWSDIQAINPAAKERIGYPTQKPEALLERIIKASSNEGDLILDAYCGCGTTVAVAERLKRNWIGIDITYQSISLMIKRLTESFGDSIINEITVDGIPKDLAAAKALATREDDKVRKEFEKWAALTYSNNRAVINTKKGADQGIDGMVYFATAPDETARMIIQVKSGGAHRGTIATLKGDMEREKAELGTLITLDEPSKSMKDEAMAAGFYHHELMGRDYPRIKIVTIREMIEDKTRMDLPLSFNAVKTAKRTEKESGQLKIGFD